MTTVRPARRYLSAADVQRMTMVTYRQLDHWCRTFDLHPEGGGKGGLRLFTYDEARIAATIASTGDHGTSVSMYARPIIAAMRAQPLATHVVLHDGKASAHTSLDRALDACRVTGNNASTLVPVPMEAPRP